MVNVLIVGGGGREHTLGWKLDQSPKVESIRFAPGNAGTAEIGTNVPISAMDIPALADYAEKNDIGLTVVGPENPLDASIVDYFEGMSLRCFGPSGAAAKIEGSKIFAKRLMKKAGIPTADFLAEETGSAETAKDHVREIFSKYGGVVVKADGLKAGKGVKVCHTLEEGLKAADKLNKEKSVMEKLVTGGEFSYIGFTDGKTFKPLLPSQDHKPRFDGDKGDNTGGMGAFAPTPIVTEEINEKMMKIMNKAIGAMRDEGAPYKGVLYAGCMLTEDGPMVLEYNCRFGDPETQPTLTLLESDLYEAIDACLDGRLDEIEIVNKPGASCCVVMASGGYPGPYEKGKPITIGGIPPNVEVFHAGTVMKDGQLVTNGGRVLGVTSYSVDIPSAIKDAYAGVENISWEGEDHRHDIGHKALKRLGLI